MAGTVHGTAVNVRQSEGGAGSRKAELKFIYYRFWYNIYIWKRWQKEI